MSQVLKTWIEERTGLVFDKSWLEDRGGSILASLLNSFTLLTDEHMQIILAKKEESYTATLEVMRLTIVSLGIDLTKEEYENVLNAKGNSTTRLLYELYVLLHDKDAQHFIEAKLYKDEQVKCACSSESIEESKDDIEIEKFDNPLAVALDGKEEVVTYHIHKYLELMDKCKKARQSYLNKLNERQKLEEGKIIFPSTSGECKERGSKVEELPLDAESLHQSTSTLMKESKDAQQMDPIIPDETISRKIIKGLQKKGRHQHNMKALRETYTKKILKDVWERILKDQEEYFKTQFVEKLKQQSTYEQQITAYLMQIRDQRDIIIEARREENARICQEKERQFMDNLMSEERKKDDERYEYYMELERKRALHRKLCEEKAQRRKEKMVNECRDIMKDILDMSFFEVEFNETHCEKLPRRKRDDLARLFIAQEPIFDQLDDVSEVIPTDVSSSVDLEEEELDEINMMELDRQNAMDDLTFEDYHNFKWPWDFNYWMEFDSYTEMVRGLNVLGHVVHRLLLGKYPRRPLPAEPAVPRTQIAVCVNGLHKLNYLPALEQLLKARKVEIIQLQETYNYCLDKYKEEITTEYPNGVFDRESEDGPKQSEKNKKKQKKSKTTSKKGSKKSSKKSKSKSKSSRSSKSEKGKGDAPEKPTFADKINQTPKIYPDEEIVLSAAGAIGKEIFDGLNSAQILDEVVNAGAIVEYLKTINLAKLDGWVLINYPQTIQQAIALEETLSCVRIPMPDIDVPPNSLEEAINEEEQLGVSDDKKQLEEKRKSKLLANPIMPQELDYDTFLTAFIEMKTAPSGDDAPAESEEYYDCFKNPENNTALNQFYQDQGCKYSLFYKTIDFATVKHLGKLILGDYSMPPKDSTLLFTDTIDYVEANFDELTKPTSTVVKEGTKKERKSKDSKKKSSARDSGKKTKAKDKKSDKSSKKGSKKDSKKSSKKSAKSKSSKSKKSGKGKKGKAASKTGEEVEQIDEETQIPTPVPEPQEPIEPPLPPPLAGEYRWVYHDLPLPDFYEKALATLWENVEEVYITDIKQLFFRRRILLDALIPYNTYVKNNLHEYIARPDEKQQHLHGFQMIYNEFDDDMREDEEVKAEIHLRIEEFREKLWKICDARMLENENERVRVCQENWITTLLIELCNIYTSFAQIEVDRSSDTSQLLIDYYSAIITGAPCKDPPIDKLKLEMIKLPQNIEELDHVAPFVEFTEDHLQQVDSPLVAQDSPFVHQIRLILENCQGKITASRNLCRKVKETLHGKFTPKTTKSKSKHKEGTIIEEPEEDVKHRAGDLIQELEAAVNGEFNRCNLRLRILDHVFNDEVRDVLEKGGCNFHMLYRDIERRYRAEIRAVDEATRLLKRAVEEETKLQPELLLQDDMFYVKLGDLLYESPLPPDDTVPVREPQDDELFTATQLLRIADILFNLAPTGMIPERAFTFLLQEFLVHNAEDGKEDLVPKMWQRLEPYKTHKLMTLLFGDTEYIDWKDFILYNLAIRFPDEYELLNCRAKFRVLDPDMNEFIYEHQYPAVHFWFEDDLSHPRLKYTRELLFKLYKIDDRLNYTALLLAFCKDVNPILGLVKALEVSLGKHVCYDEARGCLRHARSLKHIMQKEIQGITKNIERTDTINMSRDVVERLIDETVHCSHSAVLVALENEDVKPICSNDVLEYLHQEPRQHVGQSEKTSVEASTVTVSEFEADDELFTNTGSQGHCVMDGLEYQISFDVLANVFSVMIPWIHKVRRFGEVTFHERFAMIYNSLINEDIRVAYLYQILMHEDFLHMFQQFYKFHERNPHAIITNLLSHSESDY